MTTKNTYLTSGYASTIAGFYTADVIYALKGAVAAQRRTENADTRTLFDQQKAVIWAELYRRADNGDAVAQKYLGLD